MPALRGTLTSSERQRKREQDREYQRRKRERDRNLISSLRKRISTIESQGSSKNSISESSLGPASDADGKELSFILDQSDVSADQNAVSRSSPGLIASLDTSDLDLEALESTDNSVEIHHGTYDPVSLLEPPTRWEAWDSLNHLLHLASSPVHSVNLVFSTAEYDSHVIIAGVLHGWNTVASVFKFGPVWKCLRSLDEMSLCYSGLVDRMAALKVIASMLRSQSGDGQHDQLPLPPYLWPRPSQLSIPHPKLIDYFVWPGFRERMVFHHTHYAATDFARHFSEAFRFIWSDIGQEGAYEKAPGSPLYRFTDGFLASSRDIRCYRMQHEFLLMYPEFYGDVPVVGTGFSGSGLPQFGCEWESAVQLCGVDKEEVEVEAQTRPDVPRTASGLIEGVLH